MNKNMQKAAKFLTIVWLTIMSVPVFAQEVEMADTMRSNGKIYVIVAIILMVLVGLIAYLFMLDRKVRKLEKRLKNEP
jgi:CcmD family protein